MPKKWGGWELKDIHLFAQALATKMGWTLLTGQNLWTHISYHKFIWPQNMLDWVQLPVGLCYILSMTNPRMVFGYGRTYLWFLVHGFGRDGFSVHDIGCFGMYKYVL